MTKLTQAFIFAAGRGERMKPLTDTLPKPLVKIKNKAIIDYTIEKLSHISDIKKIIINGFYLAEQIEEHIKKLNNPKIIFSREIEKVETGGALVFAKDKIDLEAPLLIINGDVLWREEGANSDIELMAKQWDALQQSKEENDKCDILLGLKRKEDYLGYEGNEHGGGDFDFFNGNLFRVPDVEMGYVFVGLQIINPRILAKAPGPCFSMAHFYKSAVGEGGFVHSIKGFELKGRYFHISRVATIKEAEEKL
jgi:MurNAc alpha-1-phosphate uridylyltransferase